MTSLSLLSEKILLAAEECQLEGVVKRLKAASQKFGQSVIVDATQNIKSVKSICMEKLTGFDH